MPAFPHKTGLWLSKSMWILLLTWGIQLVMKGQDIDNKVGIFCVNDLNQCFDLKS